MKNIAEKSMMSLMQLFSNTINTVFDIPHQSMATDISNVKHRRRFCIYSCMSTAWNLTPFFLRFWAGEIWI